MGKRHVIWLILGLLCYAAPAFATHIVGGEFELTHKRGDSYTLNLILYNDDINGNPGAIDPWADVFIWSKRGNMLMGTYRLYLKSQTPIKYNVPNCPSLPIKTSKVVYASDINLYGSMFNEASGYYVTYERCCRNNIIDNIVSPESTGQTFYMEFPAVVKEGSRFTNSSPVLLPPPSDYLPVGENIRIRTTSHDPDGDSLVHRLVDPLAGYSSPDAPIPNKAMPRPYEKVRWQSRYGTDKMILGDPSLSISREGVLELAPAEEGLFVFAIVVEEYRNKVKIGEVRREYQIVVYTPNNNAPDVRASLNEFEPVEELFYEFVLGQTASFVVRVTDEEKNRLILKAEGVGFNLQNMGMSFNAGAGKGQAEGTFSWKPNCNIKLTNGEANYTLRFIGEDLDICNANQADVLLVHLKVVEPVNQAPVITASLSGRPMPSPLVITYDSQKDELLSIDITGVDRDANDLLFLRLDSVSTPSSIPYIWQNASGKGTVSAPLGLQGVCGLLNGQSEALLTFYFSVKDDVCTSQSDTVSVKVLLKDKRQDFENVTYVNVFTPNGDRCNPWFEILNLPEDACQNSFEFIRIYNRWGKLLFESRDRNFRWYGEDQPAGTYYYLLKYTNFTYRSPLSLVLGDQASNQACSDNP